MTIMAKTNQSLALFSLFLMLLHCFNIGESSTIVSMKTWCVAKPSTKDTELKNNMAYACEHMQPAGYYCSATNPGGPCYNPNTLIHHSSFAMNAYYQEVGRNHWNCDFYNSGLITINDPSHQSCIYNGGITQVDLSTSGRWCVVIPMADDALLQSIIDNACKRVDCSLIKYGGTCYKPSTLINHASVAMNLYFQATGRLESNCDFNNTGLIVISDPSSIIGSSVMEVANSRLVNDRMVMMMRQRFAEWVFVIITLKISWVF